MFVERISTTQPISPGAYHARDLSLSTYPLTTLQLHFPSSSLIQSSCGLDEIPVFSPRGDSLVRHVSHRCVKLVGSSNRAIAVLYSAAPKSALEASSRRRCIAALRIPVSISFTLLFTRTLRMVRFLVSLLLLPGTGTRCTSMSTLGTGERRSSDNSGALGDWVPLHILVPECEKRI